MGVPETFLSDEAEDIRTAKRKPKPSPTLTIFCAGYNAPPLSKWKQMGLQLTIKWIRPLNDRFCYDRLKTLCLPSRCARWLSLPPIKIYSCNLTYSCNLVGRLSFNSLYSCHLSRSASVLSNRDADQEQQQTH